MPLAFSAIGAPQLLGELFDQEADVHPPAVQLGSTKHPARQADAGIAARPLGHATHQRFRLARPPCRPVGAFDEVEGEVRGDAHGSEPRREVKPEVPDLVAQPEPEPLARGPAP